MSTSRYAEIVRVRVISLGEPILDNSQIALYFTRSHLSIRYFSTLETTFSLCHLLIVILITYNINYY